MYYSYIFLILDLSDHQLDLLKTIHWSSETIGKFIDESGRGTTNPSQIFEKTSDLHVGDDCSDNIDLEQTEHYAGYGESNSINLKPLGNETLRIRTPTRGVGEMDKSNSLTLSKDDTVTNSPQKVNLNSRKLDNPAIIPLDNFIASDKIDESSTYLNPESKISRSVSEGRRNNPSAKRQSVEFLSTHIHRGRRASADAYIPTKRAPSPGSNIGPNDYDWLNEDVPDPDAEDWGTLQGILSILNPEKSLRDDPPIIQLEEVAAEGLSANTLSIVDHNLDNVASIQQQRLFSPKDSQQQLLHSEPVIEGLGYIDDEVESIASRSSSLPTHPHYVGPVFRSIPSWIPIRTIYIALFLLLVTLALNIIIIVSSISQWSNMPQCSA